MRFYGKAESVAKRILEAFERGEIPRALAQVYIHLLVALAGHSDARGYRQWQDVGRHVKKGERAFGILAPLTRKVSETDGDSRETKERVAVYGFRYVPGLRPVSDRGGRSPRG
jgi:hypothetical protein